MVKPTSPYPKCPHCGEILEYDYPDNSWYDIKVNDPTAALYQEKWYGWCEKCDRDFSWIEVYTRTDIIDMTEEEVSGC